MFNRLSSVFFLSVFFRIGVAYAVPGSGGTDWVGGTIVFERELPNGTWLTGRMGVHPPITPLAPMQPSGHGQGGAGHGGGHLSYRPNVQAIPFEVYNGGSSFGRHVDREMQMMHEHAEREAVARRNEQIRQQNEAIARQNEIINRENEIRRRHNEEIARQKERDLAAGWDPDGAEDRRRIVNSRITEVNRQNVEIQSVQDDIGISDSEMERLLNEYIPRSQAPRPIMYLDSDGVINRAHRRQVNYVTRNPMNVFPYDTVPLEDLVRARREAIARIRQDHQEDIARRQEFRREEEETKEGEVRRTQQQITDIYDETTRTPPTPAEIAIQEERLEQGWTMHDILLHQRSVYATQFARAPSRNVPSQPPLVRPDPAVPQSPPSSASSSRVPERAMLPWSEISSGQRDHQDLQSPPRPVAPVGNALFGEQAYTRIQSPPTDSRISEVSVLDTLSNGQIIREQRRPEGVILTRWLRGVEVETFQPTGRGYSSANQPPLVTNIREVINPVITLN